MAYITQKLRKNMGFFTLAVLLLVTANCFQMQEIQNRQFSLEVPSGEILKTKLAVTHKQQNKGLSGVRDHEFQEDNAMLFVYSHGAYRTFWMPNTYFNLDIFFLDENLKVLSIERNMQASLGKQPMNKIARTANHFCHFVLEVKSQSPLAKRIKVGDNLKWKSKPSLEQIRSNIHLLR